MIQIILMGVRPEIVRGNSNGCDDRCTDDYDRDRQILLKRPTNDYKRDLQMTTKASNGCASRTPNNSNGCASRNCSGSGSGCARTKAIIIYMSG